MTVKRIKKRMLIIPAVLAALLLLLCYLYYEDNALRATVYHLTSDKVSGEFTVVQLSDLHSKAFGADNADLIALIDAQDPDLIVDTGDLIDDSHFDVADVKSFESRLTAIAPVCFVTGNHEWESGRAEEVIDALRSCGVRVLRSTAETFTLRGQTVSVGGTDDIAYTDTYLGDSLKTLTALPGYRIFLMHQPQHFSRCAEFPVDLVLSGHTHGGQVRIPFIGSVFAPNQGFFPHYDWHLFTENNSTLIISGGLGTAVLPIRILAPPEIVVIKVSQK